MNHNLLSLVGLCKRAGMLAVGEEPVEAVSRARDARILLLAADAADNTARRVRHFAEAGNCLWIRIPFTKADLGRALGVTVCAIAAITDIGFAAAFVRRLADEDPVHYDETAARLELKARRAAERKAEQRAHEKNLRLGKKASPTVQKPMEKTASSGGTRNRNEKKRTGRSARPHSGGRTFAANRQSAPYSHSRPVKKGKGSFRKKAEGNS